MTLASLSSCDLATVTPLPARVPGKPRGVTLCPTHAALAVTRAMAALPSLVGITVRANGTARCVCCHAYRDNCALVKLEWKRVVSNKLTPKQLVETYLGGVLEPELSEPLPDEPAPF